MNKMFKMFLASLLVVGLTGCGSSDSDKETLKVFNWGEYIDEDVLDAFEEEYDCNIIYETFDTNESMYVKLQGGNSYDVMIPSEYMIEKLIEEDLIQEIDMSLMTNLDGLNQDVLYQDFDPENVYWVPYFCGNVGIVYDTTIVDQEDVEEGWSLLMNEKYAGNIYMYNSVRDSFIPALKSLGYSMNSTDETEIAEAAQWLIDQREIMDPVYVGDEVIDSMIRGEKAIAVLYSGDAATVLAENEDMAFYLPEEEGTNYWFDGMVLSKDCENVELATAFMNYMISDEVALLNTLEVGYYSTNVYAASVASQDEFVGNDAYSFVIGENDECFAYQSQEIIELYSSYWEKILTQ
ncbi:ABC transporter substrate-binding protein [Tannockella kyphosi]|uniref:ABC transporter substrate-binding protein n=1 Tax=Tannockella kyphosi TaxID=2899121 RepID=UPI002012A2FC|nr:ABC transporter substrate-binding protein [Tannockella kyphosi]